MIDTQAEFIMEVTDKTKADVKVRQLNPTLQNDFSKDTYRVVLSSTMMAKCVSLRSHRFLRNTSRTSSQVRTMRQVGYNPQLTQLCSSQVQDIQH